jgi:hypothetical protein
MAWVRDPFWDDPSARARERTANVAIVATLKRMGVTIPQTTAPVGGRVRLLQSLHAALLSLALLARAPDDAKGVAPTTAASTTGRRDARTQNEERLRLRSLLE